MKKVSILASLFLTLFVFSCKKAEVQNPLSDYKNLSTGSYITKISDLNLNMDYNKPTSKVGITVDQYGSEVDKIVLYVVEGANPTPSAWKKIKEIPFTGKGTEISATEGDVATALGVTPDKLSPGNYYTFYNQVVTKDGKTYDVSNTPGALENNSNYNSVFRWQAYVTCPYVQGQMGGKYKVLQDDWADWVPGDVVTVTETAGKNQLNLSQVWPNPAYGDLVDPLLVNVDPATGTASVPFVTFGAYSPLTSAQGSGDGDVAGYAFACTGYITLSMQVIYNGSNQGNLKLVLQKQ
jgi:hypothetical protein